MRCQPFAPLCQPLLSILYMNRGTSGCPFPPLRQQPGTSRTVGTTSAPVTRRMIKGRQAEITPDMIFRTVMKIISDMPSGGKIPERARFRRRLITSPDWIQEDTPETRLIFLSHIRHGVEDVGAPYGKETRPYLL